MPFNHCFVYSQKPHFLHSVSERILWPKGFLHLPSKWFWYHSQRLRAQNFPVQVGFDLAPRVSVSGGPLPSFPLPSDVSSSKKGHLVPCLRISSLVCFLTPVFCSICFSTSICLLWEDEDFHLDSPCIDLKLTRLCSSLSICPGWIPHWPSQAVGYTLKHFQWLHVTCLTLMDSREVQTLNPTTLFF